MGYVHDTRYLRWNALSVWTKVRKENHHAVVAPSNTVIPSCCWCFLSYPFFPPAASWQHHHHHLHVSCRALHVLRVRTSLPLIRDVEGPLWIQAYHLLPCSVGSRITYYFVRRTPNYQSTPDIHQTKSRANAFGTSHGIRSLPGRVHYLHGIARLEYKHGVPTGGTQIAGGGGSLECLALIHQTHLSVDSRSRASWDLRYIALATDTLVRPVGSPPIHQSTRTLCRGPQRVWSDLRLKAAMPLYLSGCRAGLMADG